MRPRRPARRDDFRTEPFPAANDVLPMDAAYDREQFARIQLGSLPREQEDKWFAYFEDPWLHLHRSWTGYENYQVRFRREGDGARAVELRVNRSPDQYRSLFDPASEPHRAEAVINLLLAFHGHAAPIPEGTNPLALWSDFGRAMLGEGPEPGVEEGES